MVEISNDACHKDATRIVASGIVERRERREEKKVMNRAFIVLYDIRHVDK